MQSLFSSDLKPLPFAGAPSQARNGSVLRDKKKLDFGMNSRNPSTWDDYDRGLSRTGSVSSTGGRSVQFREDDSLLRPDRDESDYDGEWPGRRQSIDTQSESGEFV